MLIENSFLNKIVVQHVEYEIKLKELNQNSPTPRKNPYREQKLTTWQDELEYLKMRQDTNMYKVAIITGQHHFSKKSFNELTSITLQEMEIPKIHNNYFLACRTISEAITIIGAHVLQYRVLDILAYFAKNVFTRINGYEKIVKFQFFDPSVEELALFNCQDDRIPASSWLPIGTIIFIKEPYLKYNTLDSDCIICVNSPSDVIFVEDDDEKIFKRTRIENWFNEEIRIENLIDRKNLEELDFDKDLRYGKVAYNMRKYTLALSHYEKSLINYPSSSETLREILKVKTRIKEEQTGVYDMNFLFEQTLQNKYQKFDVAEYKGPVEIVDIPGKGRGLIASKDVEKETLLLVAKAFSWTINEKYKDNFLIGYNLINDQINQSSLIRNITTTMLNLKKNPHMAEKLYSLYAGESFHQDDLPPYGIIDPNRIEGICCFNQFTTELAEEVKGFKPADTDLWIFPSFINHSCLENTARTYYGDVMFIHAITDLKKGDEITLSYVDQFDSYEERTNKFKIYGFVCNCQLCDSDRNDENRIERDTILEELPKIQHLLDQNKSQKALNCLLPLIKKVRQTYKNRKDFHTGLLQPLLMLALIYKILHRKNRNIFYCQKQCKILEECLKIAQVPLIYANFPKIHEEFCIALEKLEMHGKAVEVAKEAYGLYRIKTGLNKLFFIKSYPNFDKFLKNE